MRPCKLRDILAACARSVVMVFLVAGLAACAADVSRIDRSTEPAAYVGVFTGEYVDGKPLFHLPSIEVVGSRRNAATDL